MNGEKRMIEKRMIGRRRAIRLITAVAITLFFCMAASAFAEEGGENPPEATKAALAVYQDDQLIHAFTMDDLAAIAKAEGSQVYTYSAVNNYPSVKLVENIQGPTVEGILDAAGVTVGDEQVIEFIGNDKISQKFLGGQLLGTRYCYPNVEGESGRKGQAPLSSSCENAFQVPAVISLVDESSGEKGRLLFGQQSPTEQNNPAYIKYLARGDKEDFSKIGSIVLHSEPAGQWNALKSSTPKSGAAVKTGTAVTFDRSVNPVPNTSGDRYWIYYATGGASPTMKSPLYNYNNYNFGQSNEAFLKPQLTGDRTITIKAKVMGYGKKDSPVTTFTYRSVTAPAKVTIGKATAISWQSVKVTWTAVTGATGYEVWRSTKSGTGYTLCKKISGGKTVSFTNTSLKTGTTYYYKVRAVKTVNGTNFYGIFSGVKGAKPYLTKAAFTSAKSSYKKATLKWKQVAGAGGYQVYRAVKKNGKYSLVKTVSGGKKLTYTSGKLTAKKTYYFKVRAWRTVSGKRVCGAFSTVRALKIK